MDVYRLKRLSRGFRDGDGDNSEYCILLDDTAGDVERRRVVVIGRRLLKKSVIINSRGEYY